MAADEAAQHHHHRRPGSSSADRQIVLWRHGRTAWNLEGRFQGQTDIELDPTGIAQAEQAAQILARLNPAAIISSDLSRAARTAEALAKLTGLTVTLDEGLRETYAGRWEGLNDAEIQERYGDELQKWRRGEIVRRGTTGELDAEVADRMVASILRGLECVAPGGTLVVATHGGASRVAVGRMINLPTEHWSALGSLSNCCWSVLGEHTRGWRLLEHNAGTLLEPVIGDDE